MRREEVMLVVRFMSVLSRADKGELTGNYHGKRKRGFQSSCVHKRL